MPHSYIRWVLDNITDMGVYLRKGITAILNGEAFNMLQDYIEHG